MTAKTAVVFVSLTTDVEGQDGQIGNGHPGDRGHQGDRRGDERPNPSKRMMKATTTPIASVSATVDAWTT